MPQFKANINLSSLDGNNGFQISGEAAFDYCGFSVSSAGDVNGDGFGDVIIGAYEADPHGGRSGASYVLFGNADGLSANVDLSTLDGSTGFRISGEAASDYSGFSVSSAGDINGDGFDDVIVGAYGADPHGERSGASYVVFGKANGFSANIDLSTLDGSTGFRISGEAARDYSGFSVSSAGDMNGDSFDDLIVGAWGTDPHGNLSGASYVVFGKADGFTANLDLSALDGATGFQISGEAAYDNVGTSVSSAGDVNGDGFDDVIVGVKLADPHGSASGASYVVFGKAGGFNANLDLSTLNGKTGFKVSGEVADDLSGQSVSGAGDVNGDGFDDIIVGAPKSDPHGSSSGASYVVFGKADDFTADLDLSTLNGNSGFQISGEAKADYCGISVSSAGDVNGDGFDDVIVGAAFAHPHGTQSGASYVVFGKADGFSANIVLSMLDGNNGFKISGEAVGDFSGRSVSSAGDVNGDGFDDVVVGAPGAGQNGTSYVIFGHRALQSVTITGTGIAQTSNGGFGDDAISGFGGDDKLIGWGRHDTLLGGSGDDVLLGGHSGDVLSGGVGRDTLQGGNGIDILNGDGDNDLLSGGAGRDTLAGGAGDDVFKFLAVDEGRDTIADFGSSDLIDVSAIDAIAGGGDDDFTFGGTTATANGVWYSMGTNRATVFVDTDGDTATVEMVIYLSGVTSLAQDDFIL